MKTCISCGMPMNKAADFAKNDESKNYCIYCAREDGSMKSFEEAKASMTGFIIKTQGLSNEAAENAAFSAMRKLPGWQSNFSENTTTD
ncbi:MAG: zinc ribbon domain-containing protein [Dehalococcoidia bacterium]|nr:zinc ribbon domain-containing protein [Dehalococcoidia bacterium]